MSQCLKQVLTQHALNAIIACGGGAVETPEVRAMLREHTHPSGSSAPGHVICVTRAIEDVEQTLDADASRPVAGLAGPRELYATRAPLYSQVATREFVIRRGDTDLPRLSVEFARFCASCLGLRSILTRVSSASAAAIAATATVPTAAVNPSALQMYSTGGAYKRPLGENTFFLSLTFPDLRDAAAVLTASSPAGEHVLAGVDAVELRVDLLNDTSISSVQDQLALLRQYTALPVIFTVRTRSQGGKFPDEPIEAMFDLLKLGVRCGCELIDVEFSPPELESIDPQSFLKAARLRNALLADIKRFPACPEIIGSCHLPQSNGRSPDDLISVFDRCHRGGLVSS